VYKPNAGREISRTINADRLIEAARVRLDEFGIALETQPQDNALVPQLDAGIDGVVTLSHAGSTARYAVLAKEQMTLSSVAHKAPAAPYPLLIISDRIARRTATAFRDTGIQFVDTLGNAFITFGTVLVEVQGRTEPISQDPEGSHRAARPQQPTNIFSPRRSQVILVLLTWPELSTARVREIADTAGVSVGQAHDAMTQLERAGFLLPDSRRVERAGELLDYWTAAYPTGLGRRLEIARYHGDPSKPIVRPRAEQPIYVSSESAEGTDIARPTTITLYLDVLDPKLPIVNRWSSSPDRAPNVFVRHKFWVSPHAQEEESSTKARNVPWPLVYADLLTTGDARLGEVARAWRTRCAQSDEV
jgi:hypothetical protein